VAKRILGKLERALTENPDAGMPLAGEFRGLFKYRAGDYRVIYTKVPGGVLVLRVGHRKDVYR
jgi:mRNA interferase RelE/StbE